MKITGTILVALFFVCNFSFAQDTMYVYKTGGLVTRLAVTDIDSITFLTSTALTQTPVLTTTTPGSITQYTAISGGNVTSQGGSTITKRGICWSTSPIPTTALTTKTTEAGTTGAFTSSMSGLSAYTKYYVRSYATNSFGTSYGIELSFTTKPLEIGFGGVITEYTSGGITYVVHTFKYDASFYPPTTLTHARVLLVGSGGRGGGDTAYNIGGGGGGGEVKEVDVIITGSDMAVTISKDENTVTSFGGQTAINGKKGSGGNGGNGGTSGNGKNGGVGQLKAGGGGGGGSYGHDGVTDNWNPMGGNGGDGTTNDISGVSTYYGGGGGGGASTGYSGKVGNGGAGGGGGLSTWNNTVKYSGLPNTGGGGCGAQYSSGGGGSSYSLGATGGSGIVIISYPK